MNILVTGGTGTLGLSLVPKLWGAFGARTVRVLSRDEHKQISMSQKLKDSRIDYFMGDVRDKDRLWYACKDVDLVFHLAATKSVDKVEYNPNEAVRTNIEGTVNIVESCLKQNVKKAIFISTDKAVEPLNVYGATKMAAERIFVASNAYSGKEGTQFSAVRYGNVIGSNGSVITKWKYALDHGEPLKITDPSMTRFWITADQAAEFVVDCAKRAVRGEVFIPEMKSCSMEDLFKAFCDVTRSIIDPVITGKRPGEKQHEKLFGTEEVSLMTIGYDAFIRWPSDPLFPIEKYGHPLKEEMTSFSAQRFNHQELTKMIEDVLQKA